MIFGQKEKDKILSLLREKECSHIELCEAMNLNWGRIRDIIDVMTYEYNIYERTEGKFIIYGLAA